jgi:hypothetical protein
MRMTPHQLSCAQLGRQYRDRDEWEKVRVLSFYNVIATNGNKTIKKPSDLFKHPWEVDERPKSEGTRRVLKKEELAEAYRKAGIPMTELQIELIKERGYA